MIKVSYIVIFLLIMVILLMMGQRQMQKQMNEETKKDLHKENPIRYWAPGHLTSNYYPFRLNRIFRRHHRFHGGGYRHH